MSTRFLVVLLAGTAVLSSALSVGGYALGQVWARELSGQAAQVSPIVWTESVPDPERSFDLGSDFERCLAAMDAAHLPGWMWECHEFPQPILTP